MEALLSGEPGSNPHLIEPSEYQRHFPKNAIKEFDKGVEADRNQQRDEAIVHYEKSILLAPDFYPSHNNLGSAYLSKADFKSAQAHFDEAIKLNQSDAAAHLNLANALLMTKIQDDALTEVDEGLRIKLLTGCGQYIP